MIYNLNKFKMADDFIKITDEDLDEETNTKAAQSDKVNFDGVDEIIDKKIENNENNT